MNLYLIRHADAGDPSGWPGDDADRPLTPLGQAQARALGEAFRQRGLAVGAVVSSPLARARQTADGVAAGAGGEPPVHHSDLLVPGGFRKRKLLAAAAETGAADVALVGHNPDLSLYLGWLTGADAAFELEKGGAALVIFRDVPEKGEGRLAWVVGPDWYMPNGPGEPRA